MSIPRFTPAEENCVVKFSKRPVVMFWLSPIFQEWLKLGVIAQQGADPAAAQTYFERVLTEFPNTQSAKLAKARLESN